MGVSGQRHAPAALLPPGKGPPVPTTLIFSTYFFFILLISRLPLTAEARIPALVRSCRIWDGHSGTGTGPFPSSSVFLCEYHSARTPLVASVQKQHEHSPHCTHFLPNVQSAIGRSLTWCVRKLISPQMLFVVSLSCSLGIYETETQSHHHITNTDIQQNSTQNRSEIE
jgi:hypothetical protein